MFMKNLILISMLMLMVGLIPTMADAGVINFGKELGVCIRLEFEDGEIGLDEKSVHRSESLYTDLRMVWPSATYTRNRIRGLEECNKKYGNKRFNDTIPPQMEEEKDRLLSDRRLTKANIASLRKLCKNSKLYKRCKNINPNDILDVLEEFGLMSDYDIVVKANESCVSAALANASKNRPGGKRNFTFDYLADKIDEAEKRGKPVSFSYSAINYGEGDCK